LSCEYLREFSKKFEMALLVYSGAWGKLIHEKNRSRKSHGTVPLNVSLLLSSLIPGKSKKYFLPTHTDKNSVF
jgi:hypothetical protein